MNVYEKLSVMRNELNNIEMKKSGYSKFTKRGYFELKDFIPHIIILCKAHKVATVFSAKGDTASITVINAENPEEKIVFESDLVHSEIQSAQKIQCLGGTHTYMRRYLYMNVFEITESDIVDAVEPSNNQYSSLGGMTEREATQNATRTALDKMVNRLDKTDGGKHKLNVMESICEDLHVNSFYDIEFTSNFSILDLESKIKTAVQKERDLESAGI